MKKFIFIFIIFTLTLTLLASPGCFIQEKREFNRTKEEIIKFDEEYWKIAQEYNKKSDEISKKLSSIPDDKPLDAAGEDINKALAIVSENISNNKEIVKIRNDDLEYYSTYIQNFKSLNIPEPLDEFYIKKIEQLNKSVKSRQLLISATSRHIDLLEVAESSIKRNKFDSDLVEKIAEDRDKLFEESKNLSEEAANLGLECDKLQREVYREYGLDDLINKWQ